MVNSKIIGFVFLILCFELGAQNYSFNFNSNGQRVCLAETEVDIAKPFIKVKLLDYLNNTSFSTNIYRRRLYEPGSAWKLVASALPPKTASWTDNNVTIGEAYEYKITRSKSWNYNGISYDAIGYTIGALKKDNSDYQGQMILLVANNIVNSLSVKYNRLKKELTGDGWFINEIVVPKVIGWNNGEIVVNVKNQIKTIYNNAPVNDKPKVLFILGHVAMPRSGLSANSPDEHDENKGARGFDGYYADIDGVYTDISTFNPSGLSTPLANNLPNDFKWDQDFFKTDVEMAFGRVDFEDLIDLKGTEIGFTEIYLDKLSNYKRVAPGFDMGEKSAFFLGYENSNDGSYRTLPNISKSINVYENKTTLPHPEWVKNNGPFKIYMQNIDAPSIQEWITHGMNATIYSSDQSYWGFNDVPQNGSGYGRIRVLLASSTKCLAALWTTTCLNQFYQSGAGDPIGFAIREMINHNATNNNIERPPQDWDNEIYWNRTYLSFNGDPTLRLFQVKPPSNLLIKDAVGKADLTWSASSDLNISGYHIYKSSTEFGKYKRLTSTPVIVTSYADLSYQKGDWYMVRAVKLIESGCGVFLQPSLGIFSQSLNTGAPNIKPKLAIQVYPNPVNSFLTVSAHHKMKSLSLYSVDGKQLSVMNNIDAYSSIVDITEFLNGIYILKIECTDGIKIDRIVKRSL